MIEKKLQPFRDDLERLVDEAEQGSAFGIIDGQGETRAVLIGYHQYAYLASRARFFDQHQGSTVHIPLGRDGAVTETELGQKGSNDD